jgi:PilZ domain
LSFVGSSGVKPGGKDECNADAAGDDAEWRPRRRHERFRLSRRARIVVDNGVLDCVLVDVSPDGAQVCLVAWAEVPEHATLLLPNAGTRPMRRCWQQGAFVGFEAVGDAVPLS